MHLKYIKLVGFKSFVDATTVPFPSHRVAIVGPNGCGKSNIIDAVRWVMGESSAKYLRGESIADVIFNGSANRQPLAQASVELVFDNSDSGFGGEYAKYNEISVRRSVNREGQSQYYLNGSRCRRRDITGIFLGTGIGTRSYAIIEQGTISRIIEAKPDEMRVYIEEAAGISKYKERRRETENRIRHTQENLERLADLREEVGKQLDHLQRQAEAAERYKACKAEQRLLQGQQIALQQQELARSNQATKAELEAIENRMQEKIAEQRKLDAAIEQWREQQTELTDEFYNVQERYYAIGSEISRYEQEIFHAQEKRQQYSDELTQSDQQWQALQADRASDQQRVEQHQATIENLTPTLATQQTAATAATQALVKAETALQAWQADWDGFNQSVAEMSQRCQVNQTRTSYLQDSLMQANQRKSELEAELATIDINAVQQQLTEQLAQQEKQIIVKATAEQQLQQQQQHLQQLRDSVSAITASLNQTRSELQTKQGQFASLEALQKAALGKEDDQVNQWLQQRGLAANQRLVEGLQVEAGWERAAETVLASYLEAVCVADLTALADESLANLQAKQLILYATDTTLRRPTARLTTPLLDKVHGPGAIHALLAGIYVADSLAEALASKDKLADHESIVTKEGVWLNKQWLRVTAKQAEQTGVIQRERQLKRLRQAITELTAHEQQLQQTLEQTHQTVVSTEEAISQGQAELQQLNQACAELKAVLQVAEARLQALRTQQAKCQAELESLSQRILNDEQALTDLQVNLQQDEAALADFQGSKQVLLSRRERCKSQYDVTRTQADTKKELVHATQLQLESAKTQLGAVGGNLTRLAKQIDNLRERRAYLQDILKECETPTESLREQLDAALENRIESEHELKTARQKLEQVEHQLRDNETKRADIDTLISTIRAELEQQRLAYQAAAVRSETYVEQLIAAGFELETVLKEMPAEANLADWQQKLLQLEPRIQRLGPINLAAIDEHKVLSERKAYLDSQNDDLTEALTTLTTAINKINKTTKHRFQETFDAINQNLTQLFPRVFGGGAASLQLTGDDLLEAGVEIIARPSGKKNATIHLLSGGEKALTAVSLIFSIFQLNPAPFCMLDEVDAPLDDANVMRYCELLREMSKEIQFIFISHNKLTIEMGDHLAGVTMHEPGVSRMVAVDVQEALQMAEA